MKLAVGSDERTYVTDAVVADLIARGHELILAGPLLLMTVISVLVAVLSSRNSGNGK